MGTAMSRAMSSTMSIKYSNITAKSSMTSSAVSISIAIGKHRYSNEQRDEQHTELKYSNSVAYI